MLANRKKIFILCLVIAFTVLPVTTGNSASGGPATQPTWEKLDISKLPSPRIGSAIVLNTVNNIVLMFGGYNSSSGYLNDLWLTDGMNWIPFQTSQSPEGRFGASMAYDEARQEMVLFGGVKTGSLLGDTWLFNGIDWIRQFPQTSPSPRVGASISYDADRNLTILFGGDADNGGGSVALDEMWVWDGENWAQQVLAILPPPRIGGNMVYDRARNSMVLFGGAIGGGLRSDTWIWDGSSWEEKNPLHHPAGRADFGMAYDESRQQVILFGGQGSVDRTETWAWDGEDWIQLPTRHKPPFELTYLAQLFYSPTLRSVMLYNDFRQKIMGPDGNIISTERSEVWALTYRYVVFLPEIYKD